ncbi:hypothetical protein RRG08_017930 [Elysia crispata]|uniref:Uncharacterized protein n=1 Tax=Elysia crispata TaxID=231223 RepID=A0AAE1A9P8_9GAST|nr:hypothetical protein RRG08_017930 [Elysia crispata]
MLDNLSPELDGNRQSRSVFNIRLLNNSYSDDKHESGLDPLIVTTDVSMSVLIYRKSAGRKLAEPIDTHTLAG